MLTISKYFGEITEEWLNTIFSIIKEINLIVPIKL